MLGFREYINESNEHDYDEREADAEFEGLTHLYDTIIHNETIDPELKKHIIKNAKSQSGLNEEEVAAENRETLHQAIGNALGRYKEAYGQEIGEPHGGSMNSPEARDSVTEHGRKAVEEHYKKTPEEQASALKKAAERIGHVAYNDKTMTPEAVGARLAGGNAKTDTVIKNPLVKHRGVLTSRVSSYGGAAGSYQHFTSADMANQKTVITCKDRTGGCSTGSAGKLLDIGTKIKKKITASCLAKSGGYNFLPSQKKIQINTHLRSGTLSIPDHAILSAHRFVTQAQAADKDNTIHATRGQTTDQRGQDIRAIVRETAKYHPVVSKRSILFGYSKDPKEVLDAARLNKENEMPVKEDSKGLPKYKEGYIPEYITHSHPGPAYHKKMDGTLHLNPLVLNKLQALRDAHATAKKEGLNINDYVVMGGKALDENGDEATPNVSYRQPKQPSDKTGATRRVNLARETQRFYHNDATVKHMRYWDLHHSGVLKADEPDSYHDEKTGTGYGSILQKGKKIKIGYYDRKANLGDTESGRTDYSKHERHDGRYADAEQREPSVQITAPVSSTSNPNAYGIHALTLAHQINTSYDMHGTKFKHSKPGMLHDAQPELMQQAGYEYNPTFKSKTRPE